jgi:hypothetical protein
VGHSCNPSIRYPEAGERLTQGQPGLHRETLSETNRSIRLKYLTNFNNVLFSLKGFVKVVKNKAYFKRYQVKFRRRRGTDSFDVSVLKESTL